MRKLTHLLFSLAILMVFFSPPNTGASQPKRPDEAQITAYLNQHPLLVELGGEVLGVTLQGEALIINLSEAVLPEGVYDEALFTQLQVDLDRVFNVNQFFMTTFKIEGESLEYWGRPLPSFDTQVDPPGIRELPGSGPLAGVSVALNAGHGWYWNEIDSDWRYQRIEFWGIREDTLNAQIMRYVQAALLNQGATVIQLREFDRSAPPGVSGLPAWHEATRHYAIARNLPPWVYDGSNNNYNSDIRARPYMANHYGADILINLHNNGYNGNLTGTETYYDTNNHPGSPTLATEVHNSIISAIRTQYDSSWVNRGIKSSDNGYGEINYAQMPAILIELAFMDKQFPDNAYLHDEAFKILAANAITKGICDFYNVTCKDAWVRLPEMNNFIFLPVILN